MTALMISGCVAETVGPQTEIYVLVDLSETWHNPENLRRNRELYREVGSAISTAAEEQEPPIRVQVRAIGVQSLERQLLCDVIYSPGWGVVEDDDLDEVTDLQDLTSYLTVNCPQKLIRAPQEALTEISASVQSVANVGDTGAQRRYLIVLSDFLEETTAPIRLRGSPLSSFEVIMIYRPVMEDQLDPASLRQRVGAWRDRFQRLGARRVAVLPDTGLRRERIIDEMNRPLE